MDLRARAIVVGMLFVIVLLSGIWLSRRGRPLHGGNFTVHKLVSLATGVLLLVTVLQQNRSAPLNGTAWTAVSATGLGFLATVASGGLLSFEKPRPQVVLRVHQIGPAVIVLTSGATLYLLLGL